MDLYDPQTWQPVLDALATDIPSGSSGIVHSIAVQPGVTASQTWTEGVGQGRSSRAVRDAVWAIGWDAPVALGVRVRVGADGTRQVAVYEWPTSVEPGIDIGPGIIRLVPHADIGHLLGVEADRPSVTLSHKSEATVIDAADPSVEVLMVGAVTGPVDLAPVAGHPALRHVRSFTPGSIVDPTVLGTLRAVELLQLPVQDWRALLTADAVPSTLVAASVDAGAAPDALGAIEVANALLARWGQPPITVRTVVDTAGRP